MKFKRLVEEVSDIDYSVMDHTLAKAKRFHDKKVDAYENEVKKLKLEIPDTDRDAHQDIKSNDLKKLHLTESLFEEWVVDEEFYEVKFDNDANNLNDTFDNVIKAVEYAKANIDEGPVVYFIDQEGNEEMVWTVEDVENINESVDSRSASVKLLDMVDEGVLDARTLALACIKYMSEDSVADMAKANNFIYDTVEEELVEDTKDWEFKTIDGNRFNRKNLSDLEGTVEITYPQVTVVYNVVAGTQYEKPEFFSNTVAKLVMKRDSSDLIEELYRNTVKDTLKDYNVHIAGSSLIPVPSDISLLSKIDKLEEGIDSNSSHADAFIKALRSAGFGDGFDQKLKIDEYQTGTRIEYKDQGGHFAVVIMEDKITLEGQDEGEQPFKKEFTTWSEFVKEFQDLYPGVPVHESNKMLNEAKVPEMINNYERKDGARYLVYKTREPLAYVIEAELTSGEICYLEKDGKVTQSVMPHKDYPVRQVSVQWDEWDMPYVKVWGPSKDYFDEAIKVAEKYGKDYEIHLDKYAKGPRKFWLEIIVDDEDTEEPYVDPDAPVVDFSTKRDDDDSEEELTGRHMKDNEDLEDSQRYPIESPAPAQTGLLVEDIDGSKIDPSDIVNWLAEHEQAEADAKAFFAPKELYDVTSQELVDWIFDHDQLLMDFQDAFRDQLINESKLQEDVMMNGALNEVRISTEGIRNFRPWEGAVSTFNNILEAGKMDDFEAMLEEEYPEGIGATELNDKLWFDKEFIYKSLGMTEYLDSSEDQE